MRNYKEKDFSALYEIEKNSFSDFWSEKGMKEDLAFSKSHYFVAEENGEIIGFGGFILPFDEAEILKIAVKKEWRNKGVGKMLLTAMLSDAKMLGADKMFLEVRKSNESARALYEKNGFFSYSVREKYYEGIEDAVLYKKIL